PYILFVLPYSPASVIHTLSLHDALPICFSLAVSGIMIPPAVFSSAAAGFTITLSCKGVSDTFLAMFYLFKNCLFTLEKMITRIFYVRQMYRKLYAIV